MTEELRKWPPPPVVYRGSEEIEGEVQTEGGARGGGETPLPAPFVARGFSPPAPLPVDAHPVVVAGPRVEQPEPPGAGPRPSALLDAEMPQERPMEDVAGQADAARRADAVGQEEVTAEEEVVVEEEVIAEVTTPGAPMDMEAPLPDAPLSAVEEEGEDEGVEEVEAIPHAVEESQAEELRPAPSSPHEDVALLLERLAEEVRERGGVRLEGAVGAPPLEGLLRGMLSGYLAHVGKGPG
jgi:hypothetical protein